MGSDIELISKKLSHTLDELEYYKYKLKRLELETAPGCPNNATVRSFCVNECDEFNESYYLKEYPDVIISGIEPYEHFLKYGKLMGRNGNAEVGSLGPVAGEFLVEDK